MPTNRLAGETSPYLLQHAHNPVDWYPWGAEALARAKAEDRPIFLSIGYAACHWCHVMERESFEDEATAAQLNRDFVAIKVDREERPDLDQVYMTAVQAMTGGGGWPMSVFLTPDGRPFYGGTYYPNAPRHGLPSFRQVLEGVARAYREQRDEVERSGTAIVGAITEASRLGVGGGSSAAGASAEAGTTSTTTTAPGGSALAGTMTGGPGLPDGTVLETAVASLERSFDPRHGGWGGAPKFPQPMTIEFLLRRAVGGDDRALAMARRTLDAMADGGIHDQLGGGFHRYATDAIWLVPHFEQMLYDNAQLARAYLHAWQLTGDRRYRDVAVGTLDYLEREMATADRAFAASQDADTDGMEGGTFTWTAEEVRSVLGPDAAPLFLAAYDVTDGGNWEGRTILRRVRTDAELATMAATAPEAVAARLATARRSLLAARATRPQPARDDKVLAGWNGLAIAALADAARALGAGDDVADLAAATRYRSLAEGAAALLLDRLRTPDGLLRRSWKDGRATADGVLEDHACLAEGLFALYQATFDERWFVAARGLADTILDHFADPAGGFFDTSDRHETLVTRPKDLQDNAVPSGNAMAVTVLLELAALTGEGRHRDAAEGALGLVSSVVGRYPGGFAQWLVALDFALADVEEVAIIGDPAEPATARLLRPTRIGFHPHLVVACAADPKASAIELLGARFQLDGRPTAFVCRQFACRQPVVEPEALAAQVAR
jgi:uncharacterized protein YyaL (SSP411 family)